MDVIVRLAVVLALVLANGLFVAAEFALVSVRRSRLEELAHRSRWARLALAAKDDPNRFISAAQLGITMASLALGWIGEDTIVRLVEPAVEALPIAIASTAAHTLAITASFAIITFMHIVLGEQVPKMVALRFAERTMLTTVPPTEAMYRIFRPFIWLLAGATDGVLRLLRVPPISEHGAAPTAEELEFLFQASHRAGELHEQERDLLVNVLDFADLVVEEIMVPRTDVVAFDVRTPFDEVLARADESPHSRFPVYDETLDNVVGILHIRSLLRVLRSPDPPPVNLRPLVRPPLFVPESMPVPQLFARLRTERVPVAIVVDEYGGMAGLVTVEDVIEEIFGTVDDEFHRAVAEIERQPDGTIILLPRLHLRDFNDELGLNIESEEADTIAGYVLDRLGRLPEPGDELEIAAGVIRVETMDGPRIGRLRFIPEEIAGTAAEQRQEGPDA